MHLNFLCCCCVAVLSLSLSAEVMDSLRTTLFSSPVSLNGMRTNSKRVAARQSARLQRAPANNTGENRPNKPVKGAGREFNYKCRIGIQELRPGNPRSNGTFISL